MSITEAAIYKRPEYSLRRWYLRGLNSGVYAIGLWRDSYKETACLRYFDFEQQVGIDSLGVVWHLPPDEVLQPQPSVAAIACDLTSQFMSRYATPRHIRKPANYIDADDCAELRELLSKKWNASDDPS